jgi:hypothetical protein
MFQGYGIEICTVDLSTNENIVKGLVDMLFSFSLQVTKKYGTLYSPTK